MLNSTENEVTKGQRETGQTVTACIFLGIIMFIAFVGNIGVILVIALYRKMRRDISNMLLINLSITDLANTCLVMLSALICLIADDWIFGKFWCDFICAVNYCLIIVSMLTLCCISIDRYQAVVHALSYQSRVKQRTLFLAICYTWTQGATFALVPSVLGWVNYDYWEAICAIQWHLYQPGTVIYVIAAFALCFLGPGLILCYCYVKIIKEVKKQKDEVPVGMRKPESKISEKSRIIWSLLVVVFAYFTCTTPFSLTKLIKVSSSDTSVIPGPLNLSSALLGYLASAINPLIYGIFRKDFQRAYLQLLKIIFLGQKRTSIFCSPHISTVMKPVSNVNSKEGRDSLASQTKLEDSWDKVEPMGANDNDSRSSFGHNERFNDDPMTKATASKVHEKQSYHETIIHVLEQASDMLKNGLTHEVTHTDIQYDNWDEKSSVNKILKIHSSCMKKNEYASELTESNKVLEEDLKTEIIKFNNTLITPKRQSGSHSPDGKLISMFCKNSDIANQEVND